MNTDWSLYCLDCESEYEPDQCRSPELIVDFIALVPEFAVVGRAVDVPEPLPPEPLPRATIGDYFSNRGKPSIEDLPPDEGRGR